MLVSFITDTIIVNRERFVIRWEYDIVITCLNSSVKVY